ncbi:MAG: TonB-dependent receptor [Candidatus Binatia bacterium]|nr:TonB-dependent receptor [Candidatus Binatia bacterium]
MNQSKLIVSLSLLFSPAVVFGQEEGKPVQLPPVVVQAEPEAPERTYSEDRARKELNRTPGGVALIGSQPIRQSRGTALHDVIDFVPGVMVRPRFGNVSDESQISIRGSGLRNNFHLRGLTLLIDGFPLNNADGFGDFESLELLAAKRIELYKGANALRFGVNTLGGAINLVTRVGEDTGLFEMRSSGGSFGFMKHQVATGQAYGPFDLYVGLTHTEQDGYREHSQLLRRRAYTSFGYRLSGGTRLRLDLNYVRSDQDLPGALTRAEFKRNPKQRNPDAIQADEARNLDYYRAAASMWMPLSDTQVLEWYTYTSFQYLDHPLSFAVIQDDTYNWGTELRYTFAAPLLGRANRLTVGFQYAGTRQIEQFFRNIRGNHGAQIRDQTNKATNFAGYVNEEFNLTDTLALIAGGQLLYAGRSVSDHFLQDGDSSGSASFFNFSPKVGFVWTVAPPMQVYGNVSRAYEVPLLLELTAPGQLGKSIRQLRAQRAWQFEIGTRGAWENRLRWDIALYDIELWNELQNVNIQPFPNAPFTIPRFRNIERSRHTGVEVGTDILLAQDLSSRLGGPGRADTLWLRTAYTWSRFVFVDDKQFGDNDLPGAPEHFIRGEVRYEHPLGLWFAPNVEIVPTGYFVTSENTVRTNPYTLVNVHLGYTVRPWNLEFFFEARNLADKQYISAVIVDSATGRFIQPGDGRAFYAGIHYRWR